MYRMVIGIVCNPASVFVSSWNIFRYLIVCCEHFTLISHSVLRSAQHSKVVPWMRKTQYISSEFNRFGVAADRCSILFVDFYLLHCCVVLLTIAFILRQEIKVGYHLTKNKENLNLFRDRQSQIDLIKKSFEDVSFMVVTFYDRIDYRFWLWIHIASWSFSIIICIFCSAKCQLANTFPRKA